MSNICWVCGKRVWFWQPSIIKDDIYHQACYNKLHSKAKISDRFKLLERRIENNPMFVPRIPIEPYGVKWIKLDEEGSK